jgi:hypothetical protein
MKKILFAVCTMVMMSTAWATNSVDITCNQKTKTCKRVETTTYRNDSTFTFGPSTTTAVTGSQGGTAYSSGSAQAANTTDDTVSVDAAVKCNKESYQLEGILQGLAGGMSKVAIAKLIKDSPPEVADSKVMLRDLDLVTSDPHFLTADPSVVLGFVFKTCLITSM